MRMIWGVRLRTSLLCRREGKGLYFSYPRTCGSGRSFGAFFFSRTGQATLRPLSAVGCYYVGLTDEMSR